MHFKFWGNHFIPLTIIMNVLKNDLLGDRVKYVGPSQSPEVPHGPRFVFFILYNGFLVLIYSLLCFCLGCFFYLVYCYLKFPSRISMFLGSMPSAEGIAAFFPSNVYILASNKQFKEHEMQCCYTHFFYQTEMSGRNAAYCSFVQDDKLRHLSSTQSA